MYYKPQILAQKGYLMTPFSNFSSDTEIDGKTWLIIITVFVFACGGFMSCSGSYQNALTPERAKGLFAEAAGGNPTITDMDCSNTARVFGDPHYISCNFKIDGLSTNGWCSSASFSKPVCNLDYDPRPAKEACPAGFIGPVTLNKEQLDKYPEAVINTQGQYCIPE